MAQQLAPVHACSFGLFEATGDTGRKFACKVRDVLCLLDGYLPFPRLFSYGVPVVSVGLRSVEHLAKAAGCCGSSRLAICAWIVALFAGGASPSRIFRQLLTESVLLVATGSALRWLLAIGATRTLAHWARIDAGLAPDRAVLVFTLVVASLVAVAFSLIPLSSTMRISLEQALKNSGSIVSQSRRGVRAGNAAIAIQIAMCFTLLLAAGLTVRTLLNYEHVDLGMRADLLLVFDVNPQGLA